MSEVITINLNENPDIKELLELLKSPGFKSQQKDYTSLLDNVEAIVKQYNTILSELDTLKEKMNHMSDRKNPLTVMVDRLDKIADDIGEKIKNTKESIISATKNALDAVKEKGLSALGSVLDFLHVKDGLKAMSSGLEKSVESLNKAVTRVENLEKHNQEKVATTENSEENYTLSEVEPVKSLAVLLGDMPMDFENLQQDELKAVYEKLLAIGMDNNLTANENVCLQELTEEVESLLPERVENETSLEVESELDQGEEI
ncbi:MAG: hypothetical protein FWC09_01435 [Lachnospiraceae bacterium]|nr:hypothetical protein [Lachnospiraceae bacterium]